MEIIVIQIKLRYFLNYYPAVFLNYKINSYFPDQFNLNLVILESNFSILQAFMVYTENEIKMKHFTLFQVITVCALPHTFSYISNGRQDALGCAYES
jgi:hypothetical protein